MKDRFLEENGSDIRVMCGFEGTKCYCLHNGQISYILSHQAAMDIEKANMISFTDNKEHFDHLPFIQCR